ncbi:CRISPR-associated helicase Cas3/CRISPR-associated endonuclease Cas3-HD [Paenibacillus forsythiae]|uniref:CRISPR-associated helicase Cas3/CRISPR-associated endonuclease Cas3-HD n=1 Tax=Paenibacillus forsythiae TaxID=365616 RepID=A0ABU3H5Q1_9BACL|nr:CRISPR-associated helicase/endonuclease Cas3 [Paenibacillus forsythiae]MDT3426159.1 CRISPR-associated helicase Cas3/CRISPR-associated endonuclease Cas3-HD [Paenibacillus forsythiae]
MQYYAHSTEREDKSDWQPLLKHLKEVADLTEMFARQFGAGDWGYVAGLLHDLGKYSPKFQKRLDGSLAPVEHALAGAYELVSKNTDNRTGPQALMLAYIIAGHHAGLADFQSDKDSCLARRLLRQPEPYSAAFTELAMPAVPTTFPLKTSKKPGLQFSLFIRMLFSCLVDADSLNTEEFCDPARHALRGKPFDYEFFLQRFREHRERKFSDPVKRETLINRRREEIFQECLARATDPQGMFSLSLPTGTGKTLISFGFGLTHAKRHSLQRLIYVIPYTSIIEQNAQEFRDILGEEWVLEHHSNFQYEADSVNSGHKETAAALKLAEENWDMPVVVTTNVRFFESLFSAKRSAARKLHNLANSMIILDEAQLMTGGFFAPCLYVLDELVRNYGCSVMLCTATQPPVSSVLKDTDPPIEIVADPELRYRQFERVNVNPIGKLSWAELALRIKDSGSQVLGIVNTRGNARKLYELLSADYDSDTLYHLSARMTPNHRRHILSIVRERLEKKLPCILVSTQLIEAGVDIDFPVVYREIAGLDSIAQAAGRCNRNGERMRDGKKVKGDVYIFEPEEEYTKKNWLSRDISAAKVQLSRCREQDISPLSQQAVSGYYQQLYFYENLGQEEATDAKGILAALNEKWNKFEFPFAKVSREFQLIDDEMQSIIVPYIPDADEQKRNDLEQIFNQLRHAPLVGRELLRRLQPFTVQLYPYEFAALKNGGELEEARDGIFVLKRIKAWYDSRTGVIPYSRDVALQEFINI